ncbi:class I SAM-dependent methyltransferase [uncultured Jatrophihabitans sp.]|uniref:class I SAM-dependent methyltransferase n=1 Tax=uncultured Jatrophihabitans sp. TaxID=1610747 RepID=UPI0035C9C175
MTRTHTETGLAAGRAAAGRVGLVSRLLAQALEESSGGGTPPAVLDCGGGSGTYAVPLALAGCDVTVVDVSADALTTLSRRAGEAGVTERVHPVAGEAERLGELFPGRAFDAVLAHGILDAVDDVAATFAAMVAAARPGGLVSVLVANPPAAVLARALAGEPAQALRELRRLDEPDDSVGPRTVDALCAGAGLVPVARHGIGVFSDLVPGAALDSSGARQALADLDAEAADRAPFADLAGRIHLLSRRPTDA